MAANEVSNEEPATLTSMAGHEEGITSQTVDEAALKTTAVSTQRISSSLRRRACDACRSRKVKCDRQDPPCNRCVKMGVACHYSGRAKPTNSRMGMSRFLETLNNRLSECCWIVAVAGHMTREALVADVSLRASRGPAGFYTFDAAESTAVFSGMERS